MRRQREYRISNTEYRPEGIPMGNVEVGIEFRLSGITVILLRKQRISQLCTTVILLRPSTDECFPRLSNLPRPPYHNQSPLHSSVQKSTGQTRVHIPLRLTSAFLVCRISPAHLTIINPHCIRQSRKALDRRGFISPLRISAPFAVNPSQSLPVQGLR